MAEARQESYRREELRGLFTLGLMAILIALRIAQTQIVFSFQPLFDRSYNVTSVVDLTLVMWGIYAFMMVVSLSSDVLPERLCRFCHLIGVLFLGLSFLFYYIIAIAIAQSLPLPWSGIIVAVLLVPVDAAFVTFLFGLYKRFRTRMKRRKSYSKFFEIMNRKVPTRIGIIIGSVAYYSYGMIIVIWLNAIFQPQFILTWLFPDLFWQVVIRLIPSIFLISVPAYALLKWFRGIKSSWFFLGASLTSLYFAIVSLIEIAGLYYVNVGWALPDIAIEGYAFPAIYTFKLFKSIFLATFFGVLGYLIETLRRKGEKRGYEDMFQ